MPTKSKLIDVKIIAAPDDVFALYKTADGNGKKIKVFAFAYYIFDDGTIRIGFIDGADITTGVKYIDEMDEDEGDFQYIIQNGVAIHKSL